MVVIYTSWKIASQTISVPAEKGKTMDNTREKLIELLLEVEYMRMERTSMRDCADYLIANGVTINRGTDDTSVAYKLSPTACEWIPFDEIKPKDGQSVLGVTNEGEMEVYYFDVNFETCLCKYCGMVKTFNITHWMPLPQPPKGGIM